MIRTIDLKKKYGNFTAVDSINLNIPSGEIYGFLGPNGAGKTSTIMMLLGMEGPTEGEIYLFDEKFTSNRLDLRRRIGVVPEKHPRGMWPWMTGFEYLKLFADLFRIDSTKERIRYLLGKVDLLEVQNKRICEYSRGMEQKLSISRALLHDPDILFLDEPISGLDPIGIKQVRDLILSENREGRTIFISSHMLSEMEKICDRVAIIFKGKLLAEDNMQSLMGHLAKDKEIHIELEVFPDTLPEEIKSLEFVTDSFKHDKVLVVIVPKTGDYRKGISKFLIDQDLVPLSIQEKSFSLEEVFVTITKENVETFAEIGGGE